MGPNDALRLHPPHPKGRPLRHKAEGTLRLHFCANQSGATVDVDSLCVSVSAMSVVLSLRVK